MSENVHFLNKQVVPWQLAVSPLVTLNLCKKKLRKLPLSSHKTHSIQKKSELIQEAPWDGIRTPQLAVVLARVLGRVLK